MIIRPYPAGDLTFVKASHQSMYGLISSSWRKSAGKFTLDVTVPPNTSATVWLPARVGAAITESGKAADGAAGVKFVRKCQDTARKNAQKRRIASIANMN